MNDKIPVIEFRYSWVYDNGFRNAHLKQKKLVNKRTKIHIHKYLEAKEIVIFKNKIEKNFLRNGKKILERISTVAGLRWKEPKIICYVVGCARPISDPLTIGIYSRNNINYFIDTLIHELIHQIQSQNYNKTKKWFDYCYKKYSKETKTTKNHIFLHAAHYKLLNDYYGQKRLKRNIEKDKKFIDYNRAWEIVQEEGYESIIKEFRKRLK